MNIAMEIVGDMEKGTHYPPETKPTANGSELAGVIDNLISKVQLKKQEAASADSDK